MLAELVVAGALTGLMGVLVVTVVVNGLSTTAFGERRADDSVAAQRALLAVTADLRAASGIVSSSGTSAGLVSASSTKVVMLTRSTGGASSTPSSEPERVTYELVGSNLTETRETGTTTSGAFVPSGTPRVSTPLRGVLAPSATGRPLFRYLTLQDSRVQCLTGPTATSLSDPVPTSRLGDVYSVELWWSVNSSSDGRRPLLVSGGAVLSAALIGLGPVDVSSGGATLGLGQGC